MKFNVKVFIALCFSVFLCMDVMSQQHEKYRVGHLSYILHTVEKGESLGKIAARYHVTVREIVEVNTIADSEKINEGQKLSIPDYSSFIDKYPHGKWNFELYRVKKGDKIKNVAKQYGITADDIKNVNWRLDKLVEGATVRIPVPVRQENIAAAESKPKEKNIDSKEKDRNSREKDDRKREAVADKNPALTFNWGTEKAGKDKGRDDENRNAAADYSYSDCGKFVFKEGIEFTVSIVVPLTKSDGAVEHSGLSFVKGSLIAVNEMKNKGCSIKLNIFDAGQKNRIDMLIQSGELKSSNLVIAPLGLPELRRLSAFAKENRTVLAVPGESAASPLVESNPYVVLLYPQDNAVYQKMTDEKHDNASVYPVLVKPEKVDTAMLENYRAALKKRYGKFVEHTHTMGLSLNSLGALKSVFSHDRKNLVFACSGTQSFISDLIIRLNTLREYSISVYGREKWSDFNLINRSYFFDVNLHLVTSAFVDYKNDEVRQFVRLFRGAYNEEPEKNAFLGYDASFYFLTALQKYGHSFQDCFTEFHRTMLQSKFRFRQNKPGDGYVNDGCFMLEYLHNIEISRE